MNHSRRKNGLRRAKANFLLLLIAIAAAVTLLECVPLSSASTATTTSSVSARNRSVGDEDQNTPNSGDEDDSDGKAASKADKKTRKTSWQYFYQKDETAAEEEETDGASNNNNNNNNNKPRFPFGARRRKRAQGDDETQKKLEEMFTASNEIDDDHNDDDHNESLEEKKSNEEGTEDKTETGSENDAEKEDVPPTKKESSDDEEADADSDSESSSKNDEEEKDEEGQESEKNNAANNDPVQQYIEQLQNAQKMQQQQMRPMGYPGAIVYRSAPMPHPQMRPGMSPHDGPGMPALAPGQAMVVSAMVNLLMLGSRIFLLKWIIDKLAFESESKAPIQHFMWECLNDKYVKDEEIWNRVLGRAPQSMGISQRKWGKTVRAMGPKKERKKPGSKTKRKSKNKNSEKDIDGKQKDSKEHQLQPINPANDKQEESSSDQETSKTVVVMDFSTMNVPNPDFLRFADVVTFLVGSNGPSKQMFGQNPEVVLMLQSPGGEVTSFAFAAAQVARLRKAGWNVTVCVDRIAASGGYMIASQATQILASPFAMVGSVGVITETLNFYEILKEYGIQSLVLKAGDSKMPITQFGKVTDKDIQTTQKDLDETHKSFIDLCRSRRPTLDPAVCNGRILSGDKALERGMIDRILTSDEYILEKIAEGDLVMKLHLVSGNSERHMIANALQILPHLSTRFKRFLSAGGELGGGNNNSSSIRRTLAKVSSWVEENVRMDGNFASKAVQLVGLASMIRRAIGRSGFSAKNDANIC